MCYCTHQGSVGEHKCSTRRTESYIDEIDCDGTDSSLQDCSFQESDECDSSEDVCRSAFGQRKQHAAVRCLKGMKHSEMLVKMCILKFLFLF